MSGFEVLGVVLGTIPLIISAVEHYQEGLHTVRRWRSYEAELQSLKRKLGNENAIFINTCQQLLSGIVGSVEHEKLIEEPFGAFWANTDISDQIALRLDHVYEPFKATVVAMDVHLREIKSKLGLDEHGQVKWTEGKAIIREIKRASFTIKRAHFDDLLNSISSNNQYLKTLTNQSIQIEPERRVKHHGWLFSQLNEASHSMYRAIRNSLTCSCPGSHRISLRLAKPKLVPRDEKVQVLQNSSFQCAFSYRIESQQTSENDDAWSLMMLRIHGPPPKQSEVAPPSTSDGLNQPSAHLTSVIVNKIKMGRRSQSVRFSDGNMSSLETKSPQCTTETIIAASHPISTICTTFATLQVGTSIEVRQEEHQEDPVDLCHLVRKGKQGQHVECFGLISDNTSQRYPRFGVHPLSEHNGDVSMISLRHILEDGGTKFAGLSYAEGLKLAVDISSGVLQLFRTSWLPEQITSRNIFFLMEDGYPVYSQVFIVKKLSDPEQQVPIASKTRHLQGLKRTMFSLGLLLLEILLFETLDRVWDPKAENAMPKAVGQFSDWRLAAELLNQVQTVGSPRFYSAVHRFLFCEFISLDTTIGSEVFCKEVYGKTIALLEEDYRASQYLY